MSTWNADKDWADRHWPQVEAVIRRVAGRIISVTPAELDEDRAGRDYRVDCGGIAARLRRPDCQYRDLTIRSWRRGGAVTELSRLLDGAADWMVYGWTNGNVLSEWVVVSVAELLRLELHDNRSETMNRDGETAFISIPIHDIVAAPEVLIDAELHTPTNLVRRGSVHPVLPCPRCRTLAYTAGPRGMPQRRCWGCDLVWTPGEGVVRHWDSAIAGLEHEYGLAAGPSPPSRSRPPG